MLFVLGVKLVMRRASVCVVLCVPDVPKVPWVCGGWCAPNPLSFLLYILKKKKKKNKEQEVSRGVEA